MRAPVGVLRRYGLGELGGLGASLGVRRQPYAERVREELGRERGAIADVTSPTFAPHIDKKQLSKPVAAIRPA
jgi:hypothetical protein